MSEILVTGASSVVGRYLLPMLDAQHRPVIALSRRGHARQGAVTWLCCDISTGTLPPEAQAADTLIHLAPLPLLVPLLDRDALAGVRRIVAIGTTSIFTKASSDSVYEREVMASQQQAEEELAKYGERRGIRWTLFRPTLVYDGVHDKNIARIAYFIRRFHFFPVINPASGLRQPLHATDLAWACMAVLDKPVTELKSYNLAGGEVLGYREMVCRVFQSLRRRPRLAPVPRWLYRGLLSLVSLRRRYRYLNAEMAERMNRDMVFDIGPARIDFGFAPGPFRVDLPHD
ncbi:MAG: NAD-dependent epimerase/dehydratase family protein [Gammaproteobacteria bacterium]